MSTLYSVTSFFCKNKYSDVRGCRAFRIGSFGVNRTIRYSEPVNFVDDFSSLIDRHFVIPSGGH